MQMLGDSGDSDQLKPDLCFFVMKPEIRQCRTQSRRNTFYLREGLEILINTKQSSFNILMYLTLMSKMQSLGNICLNVKNIRDIY